MKVLVLDESGGLQKRFPAKWKERFRGDIITELSGEAALAYWKKEEADFVIIHLYGSMQKKERWSSFIEEAGKIRKPLYVILAGGAPDTGDMETMLFLDVEGYLALPLDVSGLNRLTEKILRKSAREKSESFKLELVDQYDKYQYIKYIIQGKVSDPGKIRTFFCEKCGLKNRQALLGVVIRDDKQLYRLDTEDVIRVEAYRQIKEYLTDYEYSVFLMGGDEVFLLVSVPNSTMQIFHAKMKLKGMVDSVNRVDQSESVSAGISRIGNMDTVPRLYEEAQKALEYRFCYGKRSCLDYEICLENEKNKNNCCMDFWHEKIKNMIVSEDENGLQALLEECKKELFGNKKEYIQEFILTDFSIYDNEMQETGSGRREFLLEIDNFEELIEKWTDYLQSVLRKRKETHEYSYEICKTLEYIRNHYMEKITVKEIAEYLNISEGYFIRSFKKQLGISFVTYLNRYRIDEAEEMLRHTNLKVYEVAEKVGIQDCAYFTRLYKNLKGTAPSSVYREEK